MRDKITEFLLLGVTAGGTGAAIAILINSGFKSDDVFAFSGALVGAAGTVAGAAWLADRTARADRAGEQMLIASELRRLHNAVTAAQRAYQANATTGPLEYRRTLHAIGNIIEEAQTITREAIARARTLDFRQRAKVIYVDQSIDRFVSFYEDSFGEAELPPEDGRDWATILFIFEEALADALRSLTSPSRTSAPLS